MSRNAMTAVLMWCIGVKATRGMMERKEWALEGRLEILLM